MLSAVVALVVVYYQNEFCKKCETNVREFSVVQYCSGVVPNKLHKNVSLTFVNSNKSSKRAQLQSFRGSI